MIVGFVLFAGGALMRWHYKRQMRSLRPTFSKNRAAMKLSWSGDCATYACPILGLQTRACQETCEIDPDQPSPRVPAERIANACKAQCAAEEKPKASCRANCFAREITNL